MSSRGVHALSPYTAPILMGSDKHSVHHYHDGRRSLSLGYSDFAVLVLWKVAHMTGLFWGMKCEEHA